MVYEWKRNSELERAKRDTFAAARKRQAVAWRTARKKNPAIARLLWRKMKQAERQFAEQLWQ